MSGSATVQTRESLSWPSMLDMMATLSPWQGRTITGDLVLRVEEFMEGDDCVVRAEIPGVDPAKDIDITVSDHTLAITAERRETTHDGGRTEFHYGTFARRLSLPRSARTDKVHATYADGVLEVRVPVDAKGEAAQHVPIAVTGKAKK